jgi:hypothetical protein
VFFWVASMVLVSFLIYVSFDRSAVISAIGTTKEGSVELDWTLWSRVATWGVVPPPRSALRAKSQLFQLGFADRERLWPQLRRRSA